MEDRIERIIKRWFVTEPALFAVICSHEIAGNVKMRCPVRSGGGRIECNPDFVREMSDDALEEALRTEVLRIMLKHPYERRPDGCRGEAMVFGSNLVISDNYTFSRFNLQTADGSGFEAGLSYEAYSRKVEKAMEEGVIPSGDPSLRDVSELWDDDPLQIALVNGVLEGIKDWGSLTGDLLESVKASSQASINWKNVLAGFRSSVLSMDRRLTRMRPSRRTGFENMGSVRRFTSRILVALDVSGSVSSEALGYFLGVANSAFKYGITEIRHPVRDVCHGQRQAQTCPQGNFCVRPWRNGFPGAGGLCGERRLRRSGHCHGRRGSPTRHSRQFQGGDPVGLRKCGGVQEKFRLDVPLRQGLHDETTIRL